MESTGDYNLPNSKITVLINQVRKMAKKPQLDTELSQILDTFMRKIKDSERYLDNGICNLNFAEVALLLQSSSEVYGKKVDLLWDAIFDYQKSILLSDTQTSNQNEALEKVEERKRKYKRKRKTNSDQEQMSKFIDNFSFGNAANMDYLNQTYEPVDLTENWLKFDQNRNDEKLQLPGCSNKKFTFLPDDPLHTEDDEYLGRYDQFHSATLTDDIFHLESEKLLPDDYNVVTRMRIDSYVINDFLHENSIPSTKPKDIYSDYLSQYLNSYLEKHKEPNKTVNIENNLLLELDSEEHSSVSTIDKMRRCSMADSLFEDDHLNSMYEDCASPSNSISNDTPTTTTETFEQIKGLENRSKSCSQDSAFYEDVDEDRNDVADVSAISDTAAMGDVLSPNDTNNNLEEDLNGASPTKIRKLEASVVENKTQNLVRKIETRPKKPRNWKNILSGIEELHDVKKKVVKSRKLSKSAFLKLTQGVTVGDNEFEKFCRMQYKAAHGEGIVPPYESDSDESDVENSESDDEPEQLISPEPSEHEMSEDEEEPNETDFTTNDMEHSTENRLVDHFNTPLSPLPSCSTSNILELTSTPHHPLLSSFFETNFEENDTIRQNVSQWRSFILPKLRSLAHRADFDIHEYGARIIDPSNIGDERCFKDIVPGKSAAEVSRYFIATLQLANTYNVEIKGACSGKISNDTFAIKTLDKTKHHELLDEYQAPSEETFRERLERAQALSPKIGIHSTPKGPLAKKLKVVHSFRQLF